MPARKRIDLERVVAVAVELADEQGFEVVTLASVAARLEIRIPSLYNYIDSLQGLCYQMTLWAARHLVDKIRRAAVGKSGDEAVWSIATAYLSFAREHPGVYATTQRAPSEQTELAAVGQELIDILSAVLAVYGFSGDDALHAIRGLRSVLHGFTDLEASGGFGLALNRDESFQRLLQVYIRGLHSPQS